LALATLYGDYLLSIGLTLLLSDFYGGTTLIGDLLYGILSGPFSQPDLAL